MSTQIFETKVSEEVLLLKFDFTSDLRIGLINAHNHLQAIYDEGIDSSSVSCSVVSGVDASPSSMVSGSATVTDGVVEQKIIGGTVGVTYLLVCTATTDAAINSSVTYKNQVLTRQVCLTILPIAT